MGSSESVPAYQIREKHISPDERRKKDISKIVEKKIRQINRRIKRKKGFFIKIPHCSSEVFKIIKIHYENLGYEICIPSITYFVISWDNATKKFEDEEKQKECPVCYESVDLLDRKKCGHRFHTKCCIKEQCPLCKIEL